MGRRLESIVMHSLTASAIAAALLLPPVAESAIGLTLEARKPIEQVQSTTSDRFRLEQEDRQRRSDERQRVLDAQNKSLQDQRGQLEQQRSLIQQQRNNMLEDDETRRRQRNRGF